MIDVFWIEQYIPSARPEIDADRFIRVLLGSAGQVKKRHNGTAIESYV